MKDVLYVEDCIVPIVAVPYAEGTKCRFLGSGFYIGNEGYLITCKHVIDSALKDESLFTYQLGKKRTLELTVIRKSSTYDISFCRSLFPGIQNPWRFIDESYITLGSNIKVYGYLHEPIGDHELPFTQRYLKGHITSISRQKEFPDSFELNIPVLFGMSGSPFVCHLPVQGETQKITCVAGMVYGCSESEVVRHTVCANYQIVSQKERENG
jgi:S1-C subfamily serine protease